ncbi:MAG TPA: ElyC/SanA/YdcF family protein, partial [Bryobacteraceae bacterium]|nr:ElyC/SanA/YdcF family protein [Bryobacteraceae bacterium]
MGGIVPRVFVRFCVAFTVILLAIQFTPLVPWLLNRLFGKMWMDSDGDILIVLTANEPQDDGMGAITFARGLYGVRAWRDGHFQTAVLCGRGAPAVGQFLAAYGVPREKIFLVGHAFSARECALSTKQMIASWPGTRVLVTSDIEIFRAERAFAAA